MVAYQLQEDARARVISPAIKGGLSIHQLNGRRLIRLNFGAFTSELADLTVIDAMERLVSREPPCSILTLTLLPKRRRPTPRVIERLKLLARDNKPYVRAGALLGLRPVERLLYNLVMIFSGRSIATFETEDAALEWLSRQV